MDEFVPTQEIHALGQSRPVFMRPELFDNGRMRVIEIHSQFLFVLLLVRRGQCKCLFRGFRTRIPVDLYRGFDPVLLPGFHHCSRHFQRVFCARIVIAQLHVEMHHAEIGKCFDLFIGFLLATHIHPAHHFQSICVQLSDQLGICPGRHAGKSRFFHPPHFGLNGPGISRRRVISQGPVRGHDFDLRFLNPLFCHISPPFFRPSHRPNAFGAFVHREHGRIETALHQIEFDIHILRIVPQIVKLARVCCQIV